MSQYQLIIENIQYLEQFQMLYPKGDLKDYAQWLSNKLQYNNTLEPQLSIPDYASKTEISIEEYPETLLSGLITSLYRFAKIYIKKALESTPFNTVDEFGFLASLIQNQSLLKSEIIHLHQMEISSGTEVLKRLLKTGLIYDYPDPHDGRAKRVSLTDEGREEMLKAFGEMHKAAHIVSGNLSAKEQKQIIQILDKLKSFHNDIQQSHKNAPLNDIIEKFIDPL